jgi:hypothetical protein
MLKSNGHKNSTELSVNWRHLGLIENELDKEIT